jgi:hypothetical protein
MCERRQLNKSYNYIKFFTYLNINMRVNDSLNEDIIIAKANQITFDEALTRAGGAHRYQILCFIYFGFQWMIAKSTQFI